MARVEMCTFTNVPITQTSYQEISFNKKPLSQKSSKSLIRGVTPTCLMEEDNNLMLMKTPQRSLLNLDYLHNSNSKSQKNMELYKPILQHKRSPSSVAKKPRVKSRQQKSRQQVEEPAFMTSDAQHHHQYLQQSTVSLDKFNMTQPRPDKSPSQKRLTKSASAHKFNSHHYKSASVVPPVSTISE